MNSFRTKTLLAAAATFAFAALAGPSGASAACPPAPDAVGHFGIAPGCFDGQADRDPSDPEAATHAFTQAGGHPYSVSTQIDLNQTTKAEVLPNGSTLQMPWPEGPVKDILVDTPPGLSGNPTVPAKCTMEQLGERKFYTSGISAVPLCPAESQVGLVTVRTPFLGLPGNVLNVGPLPLYNLVPPPGVPGRFGFNLSDSLITLDASLRGGSDYGVTINSRNIAEALAILGVELTLWGTPADPSHEAERSCVGAENLGEGCSTTATPAPFLTLPTRCNAPGVGDLTTARVDSWFEPGTFDEASFLTHDPPGYPNPPGAETGTTGCDQVPFQPHASLEPTTHAASSPTGLSFDLTLPAGDDPLTHLSQSHLKRALVTLPVGMSVNPASASGLQGCTLAQIDLGGENTEPDCPDGSKIGTVSIETPLLDHEVEGSVYLAAQNDNPFDSLLAMYIVGEDPDSGVVFKLPGKIEVGPGGRLTTVFDNQPQQPFTHLHLELKGGSRAPLTNPATCGTKTATADLSPWARPAEAVHLAPSFTITSGPNGAPCADTEAQRRFDPGFQAGAVNPLGGAYSPFVLHLDRPDGSQLLSGLTVTTPPGIAAKLASVPYCPEAALAGFPTAVGSGAAQLANPTCPAASRVGTVDTGAGSGPLPFHVSGKAYLAGPYKGAPLSFAFMVPAVAGPFDLGSVLVRAAAHVDPATARITTVSDPLPSALANIPLDLRTVDVALDRAQFTTNPTSCDPMSIDAAIASDQGTIANRSSRFQMLGCAGLGFKPSLSLRLSGKTNRGAHPALRAILKMPGGSANVARASVALPHSEFLDQSHIGTICTRVQYTAGTGGGAECPSASVYGRARAFSPLLDRPLEGPVYLRSSSHKLPDLVASLDGQIHVDLSGRIDSVRGGIRTTFASVPDAPVSKFVLVMKGGRKGLLQNSTDICASGNRAAAKFDGQNGKASDFRPLMKADCGARSKRHGG